MLKYAFPLIIAGLAYATNEVLDKLLLDTILAPKKREHMGPRTNFLYLWFYLSKPTGMPLSLIILIIQKINILFKIM